LRLDAKGFPAEVDTGSAPEMRQTRGIQSASWSGPFKDPFNLIGMRFNRTFSAESA